MCISCCKIFKNPGCVFPGRAGLVFRLDQKNRCNWTATRPQWPSQFTTVKTDTHKGHKADKYRDCLFDADGRHDAALHPTDCW